MLINVVGWYDKNNIGDESYKIGFRKLWHTHDFKFTDSPIPDADSYIMGGGDIVCPTLLDKFVSIKNKHLLSVSFPVHADKKAVSSFKNIWVRDEYSSQNASALDLKHDTVPDVAFMLEPDPKKGRRIISERFASENRDLYSTKIIVVINAHISSSHDSLAYKYANFEHFSWQLANFCDHYPASFVFVPFGTSSPWDDRFAISNVASKCKFWKKNYVFYDRLSVQDTLNMVSGADMAISTRLHSSIFSTIGATPFVDILHNHKNPNFLKSIGKSNYGISYGSFNKEELRKKLDYLSLNLKTEANSLREIRNAQRRLLRKRAESISLI